MITFLTLLAAFAVGLGAASSHFGLVSSTLGVSISMVGVGLLALLFFVALVSFLKYGAKETNWLAIFLGLASVAACGGLGYLFFMNPIKDITTDVNNPPKFVRPAYPFRVEKGAEFLDKELQINRDYNQSDAATQLLKYSGFEGLKIKSPAKETFEEIMRVVREQLPTWQVVLEDKTKFHSEFEVEWSPFRFLDDVVLEVRPEPHHDFDSIVEMRSRSRLGKGDFGVNILRLRDLKVRILLASKALEDKMLPARTEWESKNAASTSGGSKQ